MKKSQVTLLVFSILILVIAFASTALLVGDFLTGKFNVNSAEYQSIENMVKVIFAIVVCIQIIVILAQVFIGIKGILESKKATDARLHILLAKTFAIVNVVLAVIGFIGVFDATELLFSAIAGVVTCVVDACIMFCYVKTAKEVQGR